MGIITTPLAYLEAALNFLIREWRRRKRPAKHGVDSGLIGHKQAIAGLKALNKSRDKTVFTKTLPDEYGEQFKYPGESDRSIIILNGSMLEDRLETMLHKKLSRLNSDETARLLGFDGPMGTFSSKIRMAQAFGIIDRTQAKQIDLVREMRNTAAHVLSPITFDTPEIRASVRCFLTVKQAEATDVWDRMDFRTFFIILCMRIDTKIWSPDPRVWTVEWQFNAVEAMRRGEQPPETLRTWLLKWL